MSADLSIRLALPADVGALAALDTVASRDPDRAAQIARWVQAGQARMAERDGVTLGYGVMMESFFHQPFIEMVMVCETARSQGVGSALVRALASSVSEGKVWTSTNLSNQPMQRLLAAQGFELSGFVENLDPGDPELIFCRCSID